MKRYVFIWYWIILMAIMVGCYFCYELGMFQYLWNNDQTPIKLSYLILGIALFTTLFCGLKTWRVSGLRKESLESAKLHRVKRRSEIGWFVADLCTQMGLLGTIWGLIIMFSSGAFENLDVANVNSVQNVLKSVSSGMSTAMLTTFVGLVCSMLLQIQYFNLHKAIDYLESE